MAISIAPPGRDRIAQALTRFRDEPFSYPEVGATRNELFPDGYRVLRHRVRIGEGQALFENAKRHLFNLQMLNLGWVRAEREQMAVVEGMPIALVIRLVAVWFLSGVRVVYRIDEQIRAKRVAGFAYGTLADHPYMGEERFVVEWSHADDSVWFEGASFSRPRAWYARLGWLAGSCLQSHFLRRAGRALVAAVR